MATNIMGKSVRRFNRLLLLLVLLLLVAIILVFFLENQQVVGLVFLGVAFPQLPVSLLMVGALLLGLLLGPAMGLLVVSRSRHRLRLRLNETTR